MERFGTKIAKALQDVLKPPGAVVSLGDLEIPPDPKLGDFAYPCFKLSKELKKSPTLIASEIRNSIQSQGLLPAEISTHVAGAYLNFSVSAQTVFEAILSDILGSPPMGGDSFGSYGSLLPASRGTWVLEYSSPNVAKPLNIYHLRPTALGAALDRIGRFRGYDVISINHLGDWGKQYGLLAAAFKRFGIEQRSRLDMKELVEIYVKINAAAEADPGLEDEAREAFLKLEKGDPAITALWQNCVAISLKEFNRIYDRIGVKFDHVWGESHYKDLLQPLLGSLRERKILVQSEGAWIVPVIDLEGKELPPCILQKSDGATIYATRDVAAAIYRYEQFRFDRMTYIVGGEQRLHFQQVFGVLRKMGFSWVSRCEHVPTGLYRFKDAKMSTRKGNFITLEEVLALAKERVVALMHERLPSQQDPENTDLIAEAVAVGAVVFHDLHTDPARDVEFDVNQVVNFEGETGPYLQYAHTRCLSILRKARETGQNARYSPSLIPRLVKAEEIALVKVLGQFPIHLERTLKFAKASQLGNYLIDVTRAFGSFYRECHVLGEEPELSQARLMLVEATRRILGRGLTLMGLPLPERM